MAQETLLSEGEDDEDGPTAQLGVQRLGGVLRTVSHNLSRPAAPRAAAQRPRIQILYRDEALRARFCKNAQELIVLVQSDPTTSKTTSAFIARKALQYRRMSLETVCRVDTHDPTFDVSSFFGVQWRKASDEGL